MASQNVSNVGNEMDTYALRVEQVAALTDIILSASKSKTNKQSQLEILKELRETLLDKIERAEKLQAWGNATGLTDALIVVNDYIIDTTLELSKEA